MELFCQRNVFFFAYDGLDSWDSFLVTEERKKLHNLVLELKGNIRVFVRVSWFNIPGGLQPRTVGRWSVVVVFLPGFFFWPFLKKSIIPRFILKEYQRKSMNNVS